MGDSYRLPGIVLEASSSKTWDAAVSEWHVVGCHDNGDASGDCLCGHEGIRYEFTIKNSVNGNELSPIGSTCILKFENDELKNELRAGRQRSSCWKPLRRGSRARSSTALTENCSPDDSMPSFMRGVLFRLTDTTVTTVGMTTSSWWICSTRERHRQKDSARRCTWC